MMASNATLAPPGGILHQLIGKGSLEGVQQHLERLVAEQQLKELNARDEEGNTPLMLAVQLGHMDIVKYLLTLQDMLNLDDTNDLGQSVADIADANGTRETLAGMLEDAPALLDEQNSTSFLSPEERGGGDKKKKRGLLARLFGQKTKKRELKK
jgi:ankyrin repeat protein